jgi:hypothetical protein
MDATLEDIEGVMAMIASSGTGGAKQEQEKCRSKDFETVCKELGI